MRKQTVTSNGEGKNLQYGVRVMAILILAASVSFPANADDFHLFEDGQVTFGHRDSPIPRSPTFGKSPRVMKPAKNLLR